jgi:hypothetical protein
MHGSVEMKPLLYSSKPFTFVMNSYQSVILLLFNKHNELTFTQIKQMTNIPDGELNPALIHLCNPKQRVLEKEDMKKPEFRPEEKMKIAASFTHPNVKVVFTPPTTHKKKEGANEANKQKDEADDKEIRMER